MELLTKPLTAKNQDCRAHILETAVAVFIRYGYKKTSMDDVAHIAGLSRDILQHHFECKTELFRALVNAFAEQAKSQRGALLAQQELELSVRLLEAIVMSHSMDVSWENFMELMASAQEHAADIMQAREQQLAADLTAAIMADPVCALWNARGISALQLTQVLMGSSMGFKMSAADAAEYRQQMAVVVTLICSGAPALFASQHASCPQ